MECCEAIGTVPPKSERDPSERGPAAINVVLNERDVTCKGGVTPEKAMRRKLRSHERHKHYEQIVHLDVNLLQESVDTHIHMYMIINKSAWPIVVSSPWNRCRLSSSRWSW